MSIQHKPAWISNFTNEHYDIELYNVSSDSFGNVYTIGLYKTKSLIDVSLNNANHRATHIFTTINYK